MSNDSKFQALTRQYLLRTKPVLAQALLYHRTHKNQAIRFARHHQYLKAIYKDDARHIVLTKSTQSGISEFLIVFSIAKCLAGLNVLYVLPTDTVKVRFVQARFNKSVEFTDFYKKHQKELDSTNMKAFDSGIINFICSNSESSFTEFVANAVIIDEKDKCNQTNLIMAKERQSAQIDKYMIEISQPTVEDYGISESYNASDKKRWHIKCDCGSWIALDFFTHVVKQIDSDDYLILDEDYDIYDPQNDCRVICDKCGRAIDRFAPGEWVAESRSRISGYQINKLFSTPTAIGDLVNNFQKGLISPAHMQRFYNADLGLPYTAAGSKITIDLLRKLVDNRLNEKTSSERVCVCGIDVGNVLNVLVAELVLVENQYKLALIYKAEKETLEDILELTQRFNIVCGVIDSRPETRMSRKLCALHRGFWMVEYLNGSAKDSIDSRSKIFKTDRTTTLDYVKETVMVGNYILPESFISDDKFTSQISASTRIWEENENGSGRYVWTEGSKPDHYFHALNYLTIAKKLLVMAKG